MKLPVLSIVVPCYKEQEVLPETISRLSNVLSLLIQKKLVLSNSYILLVNDGSEDGTWDIISEEHKKNAFVCGLNLAANVGHQCALWAGLTFAATHSDVSISIDADLQDDVNTIERMIEKYHEGYDIVYGVRKERKTDTPFKKYTALFFYRLMQMMGTKTVYNHADFRLMSKRAMKFLMEFEERNLFIRGLVPLVGYKTDVVYYNRTERFAGESKYPLTKMLNFAIDGITSFSVKPIRLVLGLGVFFVFVAGSVLFWTFYSYLSGDVVPGWASTMLSLWFCSGCILIALGIVGEYIGKIYVETKHRPLYNVQEILYHDQDSTMS